MLTLPLSKSRSSGVLLLATFLVFAILGPFSQSAVYNLIFRTIAKRGGRCIEGYSMGGRGATRLATTYPQLFCSLNCRAGNVPRASEMFDPTSTDSHPNN